MTRHRGAGTGQSKPAGTTKPDEKKSTTGNPPEPELPRGDTFGPGKRALSGPPVESSFGPGKGQIPDILKGTRTAKGTLIAPLDGGRKRRRTKKRKTRGRKTRRGY